MKQLACIMFLGLLTACSNNADANVLNGQESSFSYSSRPPEMLVPFITEVLAEMKDDYKNAVSLHNATRDTPAYGRQYLLVEKYIDFILPAIKEAEAVLESATSNTLSADQYERYKELLSEWREKSTTVFGAVGRSL